MVNMEEKHKEMASFLWFQPPRVVNSGLYSHPTAGWASIKVESGDYGSVLPKFKSPLSDIWLVT